jgi:hypothetical protein
MTDMKLQITDSDGTVIFERRIDALEWGSPVDTGELVSAMRRSVEKAAQSPAYQLMEFKLHAEDKALRDRVRALCPEDLDELAKQTRKLLKSAGRCTGTTGHLIASELRHKYNTIQAEIDRRTAPTIQRRTNRAER